MKALKLILFLSLFTFTVNAQTKLLQEKEVDWKNAFSNLYEFKIYKFDNYLIRIYVYDNGSGSANLEGSDESSSSLLISKTEYGEAELPTYYKINNLLNFKIRSVKENEIRVFDQNRKQIITYLF